MKTPGNLLRTALLGLISVLLPLLPAASFAQSPVQGKWQRQLWYGIGGNYLSTLTTSPAFYQAPSSSGLTDSFYTGLGVNYGARTRGYITPSVSGLYTFWLSGDDQLSLALSPDDTKWHATNISNVPSWTGSQAWDTFLAQRSNTRYLQAGTRYYVEMLHKQGAGGESAGVSWSVQPLDATGAVQNWATPANGASASESSMLDNRFPASNAIDGNTGTFNHTANALGSWLLVDFGRDRLVSAIEMVNRQDCCQNRLSNFRVTLEDVNGAVVASKDYYPLTGSVGVSETWTLPGPVAARRVRVSNLGLNRDLNCYLHLGEIRAWGPDVLVKNWAREPGAVAAQSDTYNSTVPASNAIDGNTGTISHTLSTPGSWWSVDFGADRQIDAIELINRQDSCQNRLSNFRVSVTNTAGVVTATQDYYVSSGSVQGALRWELPATVTGRKVTVQLLGLNRDGNYYLHMGEVNVWGRTDAAVPPDSQDYTQRPLRVLVPPAVMSSYVPSLTDDADDDGYPDSWEAQYGFNHGYGTGQYSPLADPDGDGRANLQEAIDGTDPFTASGTPGCLLREIWWNMPYQDLGETRNDPRYFGPADRKSLQTGSYTGNMGATYTASRVRGWITPPETGYYRFWIMAYDTAELWISDVAGDKYHKQLRCAMGARYGTANGLTDGNYTGMWDTYASQMSEEVYLEAGKKYYLEADGQMHHGSYAYINLAWAERDGVRAAIPACAMISYVPTSDDTDDNCLPDAWESAHGIASTNGKFDPALQGEWGDFDSDGLTNREEYVLGLDPANADTGNTGISDLEKYRRNPKNPLLAVLQNNTLLTAIDLSGYTATDNTTHWTMGAGGLSGDSFRGTLSWSFSTPADGNWLLQLDTRLAGTIFGGEEVPLSISVDGMPVGRFTARYGDGGTATVQGLTPWLAAGTHTVTVLIDNSIARYSVRIVALQVFQPSDTASLLAQTNHLIPHASQSRTSPFCLEGYARVPSAVRVNGLSASTGTGHGHWYANVPLQNNGAAQSVSVAFETGCAATDTITWQATNVMDGETIAVRQGDSLLVGAWTPDGNSTATMTSPAGGSWSVSGNQAVPVAFTTSGTTTVTAVIAGGATATLTVNVCPPPVQITTGIVDLLAGTDRSFYWSLAPAVVLDSPQDLCMVSTTPGTYSPAPGVFTNLVNLMPQLDADTVGVAARLGDGGPILAVQQCNVINVSDALQNDLTGLGNSGVPGYLLFTTPLTVTNLPSTGRVAVHIFRAGVMFPDGTTDRTITNANLSNGSVTLSFLYPMGLDGGYCHTVSVYDRNGALLGSR